MVEKLREAAGKAIYEEQAARLDAFDVGTVLSWEEALESTREHYRVCGEKAVSAFLAHVRDNYGK